MSFIENRFGPEISTIMGKGREVFLKSSLAILLSAGLASGGCIDAADKIEDLETGHLTNAFMQMDDPIVELGAAGIILKFAQTESGARVFSNRNTEQEMPVEVIVG